MTLADLASVGALVSGVAVLASLMFLSYQMRQTARHQRSLLLQGQAARWLELTGLLLAVGDPAAREALGLSPNSRVLLFGTEGATDPDVYARLVGERG